MKNRYLKMLLFSGIILFSHQLFSQDPYIYQDRGNRKEGRKELEVSAPDLEILSFLAYREEVPSDSAVNLKVTFYMPEDTAIYITAKELIARELYLMKPKKKRYKKGWQTFYPWNTDEVLNPIGVKLKELGIIGRLYADRFGSGVIVPLVVYHSGPLSQRVFKYIMHLKPRETLNSVYYKLYKSRNKQLCQEKKLRDVFYAQDYFLIELDMSSQPAGEYYLAIRCNIRNRINKINRYYRFYHQPSLTEK